MTREEIKNTPELVDFMLDKCVLADSRTKVRKRLEEVCALAIKALEQQPCIQEKQANADKIDAVYIDGFKAGYSQARFDLEQQPCDNAISREAVKEIICAEFVDTQDGMSEWRNAVNDVVEEILHKVEHLPSVTQKGDVKNV